MHIIATYLMWIGSEGYKTIADWTKEALEMGVSKRLPNAFMGKSLLQDGTVVFVAHDEGSMDACPECVGTIECPDCRKNREAARRERDMADALTDEAEAHDEGSKERKSCERRAKNALKRADKHDDNIASCERCFGSGDVEEGTGGQVVFEDGEAWDYRKYMYHRNQPKKWTDADKGGIAVMKRCEHCGGFGRIPNGKVFGLFVPEAVEYIDAGDEDKTKEMEEAGFKTVTKTTLVTEKRRGCGKRKPGGVYVVTRTETTSTAGVEAIKDLGLDEAACEVRGNFVQFHTPIDIAGTKRFRGLAKWEMPEDVADEAEMIADAME